MHPFALLALLSCDNTGTIATPAPPGSTEPVDRDDDGWADDEDCDDDDPLVFPGATEICNDRDDDCDDRVDEEASDQSLWFADADGDGYGDPDSAIQACEAESGTVDDDTDCDDQSAATHPGAEELCDWEDQDCDSIVDEDLADVDNSGMADCKEVGVLVTVGFQQGGVGAECEGMLSLDRELLEVETLLAALGLEAVFFYDDTSIGVGWGEVGHFPLLIHHNGGWSPAGSSAILETLRQAKSAGVPLLFLGDDIAKHAAGNESTHGDRGLFDLTAIASYQSGGATGHQVEVRDAGHAVLEGPHGVVLGFVYNADLDDLTLADVGEEVWLESATSGAPVVWTWEDGGHRTVMAQVSVYESHVCPISDEAGLGEISVLFKNSVVWLMRLGAEGF
jgi:surface antigen